MVEKKYDKKSRYHLNFGNRLKSTKVKNYEVVQAILYRLKTGYQWAGGTNERVL